MPDLPHVNSAFSRELPTLQLAWDSTSMGAFKTCPRYYELTIVRGFTPRRRSVHLDFGIWYHGALERYDHARSDGKSVDEATVLAVRWALTQTWNSELKRPWISDDPNKNRMTLIRTIVWYLDQFRDDPIETVILANGKPAVELSFRMHLGLESRTKEEFLLCGHLDRLGRLHDKTYICDRKTTKHTLDQSYFEQFSPDNQFSTYTTAGNIVYQLPIEGLIVDAAQIAVTFSRFMRHPVTRNKAQIDEWYKDFSFWLALAQTYAQANYWPQNDKACFRCDFRGICSKPPAAREQWLEREFGKRIWDPLQVRGDI